MRCQARYQEDDQNEVAHGVRQVDGDLQRRGVALHVQQRLEPGHPGDGGQGQAGDCPIEAHTGMDAPERPLRQDGDTDDEGHVGQQVQGVTRGRVGDGLEVLVVVRVEEVAGRVQRDPDCHRRPGRAQLGRSPDALQYGDERQRLGDVVDPPVPKRVVPARPPVDGEYGDAESRHRAGDYGLQHELRPGKAEYL